MDLSEKFLRCDTSSFDALKCCILCSKGPTTTYKLTSTENGMQKIREVCLHLLMIAKLGLATIDDCLVRVSNY